MLYIIIPLGTLSQESWPAQAHPDQACAVVFQQEGSLCHLSSSYSHSLLHYSQILHLYGLQMTEPGNPAIFNYL